MKLFKCLKCQGNSVDEIIYKNKIAYKCYACGKISKQVYAIDSRLKLALNSNNELQHFLVALIIENGNNILLLNRRGYPYCWSLVMGHIHNGETPKQAAKRELIEETNYQPRKIEFLRSLNVYNDCDSGLYWHKIYVFRAKVPRNTRLVINNEAWEFRWVQPNKEQLQTLRPMSGKAIAVLNRLIS